MIDKAILAYITEAYWAMEPRTLDRMLGIITRHAEGIRLAEEELVAALDGKRQAKNTTYQVVSGNAIIPINGVIAKHASQVGGVSQPRGTSVEAIRKDLRAALEDPTVERIVLSIDSPGGSVSGIAEMADEIFLARQQKPIIAHTEGLMASAAYWLGSQANEVYATKSASVGSIGVYATIADDSRRMKNEGFDLAVLKSGSFKGPDKITGGFGEKQAEKLQEEIDLFAGMFNEAVAKGRGLDIQMVEGVADGSIFVGSQAFDAGLIDGIQSIEEVLSAGEPTPVGGTNVFVAAKGGKTQEGERMNDHQDGPVAAQEQVGVQGTGDAQAGGASISAEELLKEGVKKERERVKAIKAMAVKGQEDLVSQLVDEGATLAEAREKLHEDLRAAYQEATSKEALASKDLEGLKSTRLEEIREASGAAGQTVETFDEDSTEEPGGEDLEAQARAKYRKSAVYQEHFSSEDRFVAYVLNEGWPKLS